MDYLSGFIRTKPLKRNKDVSTYSTEIITQSYSGFSQQTPSRIYDSCHYMAEKNGIEAETTDVNVVNSKRNISSTTAQLSAQVMNLPYDKFQESISDEIAVNSMKFAQEEYDIFRKIRDAYEACACKICKCVTNTSKNHIESCNCEPCKCKECTLVDSRINSSNFRPNEENKAINQMHHVQSDINDLGCECKPCDCFDCSHRRRPLDTTSGFSRQNEKSVNSKMTTKVPPRKSIALDTSTKYHPMQDAFNDLDILDNNHAAWPKDNFRQHEKKKYEMPTRPEAPNKILELNDFESDTDSLDDNETMTIFQPHPIKQCACSVCTCIACECKGNALTCRANTACYDQHRSTRNSEILAKPRNTKNSEFCVCSDCKCKFCPHVTQNKLQPIELYKCKCDICKCLECERKPERKCRLNGSQTEVTFGPECNCSMCEARMTNRDFYTHNKNWSEYSSIGHKLSDEDFYPTKHKPSINPLTYDCEEYTQRLKSRNQLNIMNRGKNKYGNVYFVSSKKTYKLAHSVLGVDNTKVKKNNLNVFYSDYYTNIDEKKRKGKITHFNDSVNIVTHHQNSRMSEHARKDVAVTAFSFGLNNDIQVNNECKVSFNSFSSESGCRSTQTVVNSSNSSYHNNGYCTNTISLPDTNIVDSINPPNSIRYDVHNDKYETQRNIYHCFDLKNAFSRDKANGATLVHIHQNDNDVEKNMSKTLSCDFDKDISGGGAVKNHNIHVTLQKAKQFTLDLTNILHKYEIANAAFKSISKKTINSRYVVFDELMTNLNNQAYKNVHKSDCNKEEFATEPNKIKLKVDYNFSNSEHVVAIEETDNTILLYQVRKATINGSQGVDSVKENALVHKASKHIIRISAPKENDDQVKEEKYIKISPNTTNESRDNLERKRDDTINIQTALNESSSILASSLFGFSLPDTALNESISINKLQDIEHCTKEQEGSALSQIELLRTKKIQNILKQSQESDTYVEQISPATSVTGVQLKDDFLFNYHSRSLIRSSAI